MKKKEANVAKSKKKVVKKQKAAVKAKVKKSTPAKKAKSAKPAKVTKTKKTTKPTKPTPVVISKPKKIDLTHFVTPLDDRIIVQPALAEKMTAGGLYIPDTVTTVSGNIRGVVLAVGRGHRDKKGKVRPMDVQKGDRVVFAEFSGSKIKYQDQDLVIIRETDVLGIIS